MFALHHVQLAMPAGEEERARRFFSDVVGLVEVEKPAALSTRGGVWFRSGDLEIHLGVEESFTAAKKAHPGIATDDLDGLRERLQRAGMAVRPDGGLPGFRRFYVDDCFGNRLEFMQPVADARAMA